jgi:hypothetical protein
VNSFQARESSDNPRLNAFCRVAPSVRFKALASFLAGVFFRAADFSSRRSAAVHERRFDFLAIKQSPGWGRRRLLADPDSDENINFVLGMHRGIFMSGGVASRNTKKSRSCRTTQPN